MTDDFLKRVILIAKAKYDLDEDMLEDYQELIENCWYRNYTVRRTVDVVANKLFEKF